MRPFGPEPVTSASGTPSSRANRRTPGLAWAMAPVDVCRCEALQRRALGPRRAPGPRAFCGAGAGGAAAAARRRPSPWPFPLVTAGAALPSSNASSVPALTLSPTLTFSSAITPATGAGTSIVALSLSRTSSESSFFTASPGLTSSSMTGMSLKSPMSGTFTSVAAKRLSSWCAR